jgi:hypothetical protein
MEGFRSNSGRFLIIFFSTLNDKLYTITPYVHAISLNNIISQNHLMTTTCIKLRRTDYKDSALICSPFAHGRVITKLNHNQCLQECCRRPEEWHKQRRNETYFYTQAQLFDNAYHVCLTTTIALHVCMAPFSRCLTQ